MEPGKHLCAQASQFTLLKGREGEGLQEERGRRIRKKRARRDLAGLSAAEEAHQVAEMEGILSLQHHALGALEKQKFRRKCRCGGERTAEEENS